MDSEASIPPPPEVAALDDGKWVRPWGPPQVILGIVVLVLVVAIAGVVVAIFDPGLNSLGATLALQAFLSVALLGVAFTFAGPNAAFASADSLGLRRPRPGVLKLTIAAYVAYVAFTIVYGLLVSPHQKDLPKELGYGDTVLGSIVAGTLIVLVAPVCEEIFFRGFVFGGLRTRLSFVWAALISAVIFGGAHAGGGSATVLLQLAGLGLVQAYVYERSGSIYPTIGVHMLNNAIAFTLLVH